MIILFLSCLLLFLYKYRTTSIITFQHTKQGGALQVGRGPSPGGDGGPDLESTINSPLSLDNSGMYSIETAPGDCCVEAPHHGVTLPSPPPTDAGSSWRAVATPMSSRMGQIERLWQVAYSDLRLEKQIGEGSFGKVFLARWRETIVAVKVLSNPDIAAWSTPPHTEEEALVRAEAMTSMLESLEKEAAMMATLRHPNVVMYLGICLEPPCVVTEYCARGSLSDVLKRGRLSRRGAQQLDWPKLLSMALDAAKGMFFLHTNDPPIIHR